MYLKNKISVSFLSRKISENMSEYIETISRQYQDTISRQEDTLLFYFLV